MALDLITPPAREPVALDAVKKHLRVDVTDDDVLIAALITAVRQWTEDLQGRALLTQTWDCWLDAFPDNGKDIKMLVPVLQSVTSVKYYDTDDTENTMAAADYFVDAKRQPGRVALGYGKYWPTTTLRPTNGVVVRFVCGYGTHAGVVSTSGTAITKVSGTDFNVNWTAGKHIVINGVTYAIASVTSTSALTLTATAGTQSSVAYSANDVPVKTIQGMLLIIGHLYENREAVIAEQRITIQEVPLAAKALLMQDAVITF